MRRLGACVAALRTRMALAIVNSVELGGELFFGLFIPPLAYAFWLPSDSRYYKTMLFEIDAYFETRTAK